MFPGSKIVRVVRGEAGPGAPTPVLTVEFELMGERFVALNGGPEFKFTEAVSFVVPCKGQEEVDRYWGKLTADGGEESMCGWLKDKYGLSWQVIPDALFELINDPDKGRASRATQAMLQMRKIDVEKLREAADGKVKV